MKLLFVVIAIGLMLSAIGCDTELGHHDDHDHDGDGISDHAPDEHLDDMHEHNDEEENDHG